MAETTKPYTVLSPLRLDRLYGIGEVVELGDKDAKELTHLLAVEPAERKPGRASLESEDKGEGQGLTPPPPATTSEASLPSGTAAPGTKATTTKAASGKTPRSSSAKKPGGKAQQGK